MKINSKKLAELRTYFLDGGSTDEEDVMSFLGTEDEGEMQAYIDALREKYPQDFGGDSEEAEEKSELSYQLKGENNVLHDLEVLKVKNGRVILQIKEPKDLVTLMIKGKPVEVDLIQLAKYPGDSPHGVLNSKLLELAELAK